MSYEKMVGMGIQDDKIVIGLSKRSSDLITKGKYAVHFSQEFPPEFMNEPKDLLYSIQSCACKNVGKVNF